MHDTQRAAILNAIALIESEVHRLKEIVKSGNDGYHPTIIDYDQDIQTYETHRLALLVLVNDGDPVIESTGKEGLTCTY